VTGITGATAGHAALMNATYRHQRLIYDATRAHYLLGRDHLIRQLAPPPGGTVLEIACGTGRNLARIRRRYPACRLHGLDISSEMLRTARRRLSGRAALAEADACSFDPMALFGTARFDRIVLSYSLSMIPDWQRALGNAVDALAPDGALHIVDFGDQAGLPGWFGDGLHAWLARFHVTPRPGLAVAIGRIAAERDFAARWRTLYRGYAQYSVIARG
jgi:S-adenosylmethionine-diacylgycerolhomoserine-N-methlytransferase